MTDGIIKSSGNSRYLKSVPNILTLYPTYEAFAEALQSGTFPIDLNGINPSGWEQVGDKLDKATLLTDALCSALGLPTTATPTQAMEKLRQMASQLDTSKAVMISGTYVGNGRTSVSGTSDYADKQTIALPFTPKAVLTAEKGVFTDHTYNSSFVSCGLAVAGFDIVVQYNNESVYLKIDALKIVTNGFLVSTGRSGSYDHKTYVRFNNAGTTYSYLALG